jgi:hypothetical protein
MMLKVNQVEKADIFGDLVRVHSSHRPSIVAGEIIRVSQKNKSTLAVARNSPNNDREGIWMDDAMRARLDVRAGDICDFSFHKATNWENFLWAWKVTNPVNRIAAQLGVVSVVLGLLGAVLGILSVYLSLK